MAVILTVKNIMFGGKFIMKNKKVFPFLLILILVFSAISPLSVLGAENEPNSDAINRSFFLNGYSSASAVPSSAFVTYTENGRVYQGTIPRTGSPMLSTQGGWGATFSGTLWFTGIIQRNITVSLEVVDYVPPLPPNWHEYNPKLEVR